MHATYQRVCVCVYVHIQDLRPNTSRSFTSGSCPKYTRRTMHIHVCRRHHGLGGHKCINKLSIIYDYITLQIAIKKACCMTWPLGLVGGLGDVQRGQCQATASRRAQPRKSPKAKCYGTLNICECHMMHPN